MVIVATTRGEICILTIRTNRATTMKSFIRFLIFFSVMLHIFLPFVGESFNSSILFSILPLSLCIFFIFISFFFFFHQQAGVVVVFNPKTNTQRLFAPHEAGSLRDCHNDDITWYLCLHFQGILFVYF